jgi:hypothetical protein
MVLAPVDQTLFVEFPTQFVVFSTQFVQFHTNRAHKNTQKVRRLLWVAHLANCFNIQTLTPKPTSMSSRANLAQAEAHACCTRVRLPVVVS